MGLEKMHIRQSPQRRAGVWQWPSAAGAAGVRKQPGGDSVECSALQCGVAVTKEHLRSGSAAVTATAGFVGSVAVAGEMRSPSRPERRGDRSRKPGGCGGPSVALGGVKSRERRDWLARKWETPAGERSFLLTNQFHSTNNKLKKLIHGTRHSARTAIEVCNQ